MEDDLILIQAKQKSRIAAQDRRVAEQYEKFIKKALGYGQEFRPNDADLDLPALEDAADNAFTKHGNSEFAEKLSALRAMNTVDHKKASRLGTLKDEMLWEKERTVQAHGTLYKDHEEMLFARDEFENRNNRPGRFGLQQAHEVKLKYGISPSPEAVNINSYGLGKGKMGKFHATSDEHQKALEADSKVAHAQPEGMYVSRRGSILDLLDL